MQPPFGTTCVAHPDTPASATCSQCARAVCNSCVVFDGSGAARCPACARPASAGGRSSVPWERRDELGTMTAFVQTVTGALLHPGQMLAPPGGPVNLGAPFVFALVCHTIGALFTALWQLGSIALTTSGNVGLGEIGILGFTGVISGPFAAAGAVFLWGGIVHLGLLILSAGRGGFAATARVQSYVSATALLNVVPIVGYFAALVWGVVAQVIGLASAHETSAGRTLGAVLAPLLLCCLAGLAVFGLTMWSLRDIGGW